MNSICCNAKNLFVKIAAAALAAACAASCASRRGAAETAGQGGTETIFVYTDPKFVKPYLYGFGAVFCAVKKNGEWRAFDEKCEILGSVRRYAPLGDFRSRRMADTYIFRDAGGLWRCVWTFDGEGCKIGCRVSKNFVDWTEQINTNFPGTPTLSKPVVKRDGSGYAIFCKSAGGFYKIKTADFRNFENPQKIGAGEYPEEYARINVGGAEREGVFVEVGKRDFAALEAKSARLKRDAQIAELRGGKLLKAVENIALKAELSADFGDTKEISENFIGIFFEDVNSAADGGLYAEMIENRDFEYPRALDKKEGGVWRVRGDIDFRLETSAPIHKNNAVYAVIKSGAEGAAIANAGWGGIRLRRGEKYNFSFFAKLNANGCASPLKLRARLADENGNTAAEHEITVAQNSWQKFEARFVSSLDTNKGVFELIPQAGGELAVDMVSLFPEKTFKNRRNGLRKDLAETVAALKPKFMRFPGGCLVHGAGVKNFYRWRDTVGALEARVHNENIWGYHQTMGLGYLEYFQFCEDIGAEPLPVVPAGVSCQFQKVFEHLPMDEMPAYINDVLNLIEWANGDPEATKWGKIRARNGHPKPFGLKFLAIGNEDEITQGYKMRFEMLQKAVNKKYPGIKIIGNAGPGVFIPDYYQGWELARRLKTDFVDEHYYRPPDWFLTHQDIYDSYPADGPKVYLGEYAVHNKKRASTVETALHSALHLVNLERSADKVVMTSYAPLFGRRGHCQWNPNMIYFDNANVYPTCDYYAQKIFGNNAGCKFVSSKLELNCKTLGVAERLKASVVIAKNGDTIIKIVNLLPKKVDLRFKPPAAKKITKYTKTSLAGDLDAEDAKPRETVVDAGGVSDLNVSLEGNSLTVIRF